MIIISRSFHRSGKSKTLALQQVVMTTVHAVALLLFVLQIVPIATALSLNPSTPPGEIIEMQLEALKDGDIKTVWKFASPGNKQQAGDVTNFARMVQSGPYRYVMRHNTTCTVMSFLVQSLLPNQNTCHGHCNFTPLILFSLGAVLLTHVFPFLLLLLQQTSSGTFPIPNPSRVKNGRIAPVFGAGNISVDVRPKTIVVCLGFRFGRWRWWRRRDLAVEGCGA